MSDSLGTFVKHVNEVLDYSVNWKQRLDPDALTISSSSWTVPAGLTKGAETITDPIVTVRLSAGVDGITYDVINLVTASNGEIYQALIQIQVVA